MSLVTEQRSVKSVHSFRFIQTSLASCRLARVLWMLRCQAPWIIVRSNGTILECDKIVIVRYFLNIVVERHCDKPTTGIRLLCGCGSGIPYRLYYCACDDVCKNFFGGLYDITFFAYPLTISCTNGFSLSIAVSECPAGIMGMLT